MTIELQVNGKQYSQFKSAEVTIRIDALSNTFNFQATASKGLPLPFQGGDECKIIVDNTTVLTGSIEIVEVDYSSGSHSIALSGRDKTGDLLDSTLDSISDINAPITLKKLIEKIISTLGLDIQVIDTVNPASFNKAEDIASPEPGQSAFSFIEQYARKRQVLLTSNANGDIVITRASGTKINAFLQNVIGSNSNNIIRGNVSYDTTGRYNKYKFASSLNTTALNFAGFVPIKNVVSQKGIYTDAAIRAGRQLVLVSEDAFSDKQNADRAKWEANIRKARGRVYSVTVEGFTNQINELWDINTAVLVVDDFAGINAYMLINSVTYSYSLDEGSITTLGLVNENAYTLTLSEPKVEKIARGLFG
ncbi:MAG: hypothetical protein OQL19_07205 [Gammaproteobacteria bacterium]|nr:hypothetical protein [Gammaproteobacteria bacterium]